MLKGNLMLGQKRPNVWIPECCW